MTETRSVTAILTDQHGNLRVATRARQSLGPLDVRIAVAAAAVNPIDDYVVHGFALSRGWSADEDLGLGWDVSGVVTEVGDEVADPALTIGARVAGVSAGPVKEVGPQADEIVLPADAVAAVPDGLDLVAAASLPLNTLTADQALDLLGPAEGTLLVTGIGGAVGGFAAPLAVARGWHVLGLGRSEDRDYAEAVGAEFVGGEFLAGAAVDPSARRVDAVLDAANLGAAAAGVVRAGGALAELVVDNTPATDGLTVHSVMMTADGVRLGHLLIAAAEGELRPRVRSTHRLTDGEKAYEDFRNGGRGRVVLVTDLAD